MELRYCHCFFVLFFFTVRTVEFNTGHGWVLPANLGRALEFNTKHEIRDANGRLEFIGFDFETIY